MPPPSRSSATMFEVMVEISRVDQDGRSRRLVSAPPKRVESYGLPPSNTTRLNRRRGRRQAGSRCAQGHGECHPSSGWPEMRCTVKYLYVIEKAPDGSFSAYVPDLP